MNHIKVSIELGHTLGEWKDLCNGEDYWDFSADDLLGGAVEPNEDMTYWYIDGRLYETPINS